MTSSPTTEPLLQPQGVDRLTLFPLIHMKPWEFYKQQVTSFWVTEEIDFAADFDHWKNLKANERLYLNKMFAFFAPADGIVGENLVLNFYAEIEIPEIRCFYGIQLAIENIHFETYAHMIDIFIRDPDEKLKHFRSMETNPCVRKKMDWIIRYTDRAYASFGERLLAFAIMEGIFFSGAFCSIFWLKKRGLMPGLCFANELISRDEGLHCDFACMLYNDYLENKLSEELVHQMVRDAVEMECEFVHDALPVALIGMNAGEMCKYIQFCADRLLTALRVPKLFSVQNPFDWMELISIDGKTNFFERKVSEYSKSRVGLGLKRSESTGTIPESPSSARASNEFTIGADF